MFNKCLSRLFVLAVCAAASSTSIAYAEESSVRAVARHQFVVPKPVDQVFGLFDPIAEKEWAAGWDPEPVYPAELSLEASSVFLLDRGDDKEVWTVLRHDPVAHVAEYLATSHNYQQRWITVKCETVAEGTRVDVEYRVTALSAEGVRDLGKYNSDYIKAWEEPVAKALGL